MTTLVKIAIALTLSLLLSSCGLDFSNGEKGNGNLTSQNRIITEGFTTVAASEGLNVFVTQADDFKIKVEADENIIDLIGTNIENDVLKIYAIKNIGNATKNIHVSLPKIMSLKSSSGAKLKAESTISTKKLKLETSSGANIKLTGTTKNMNIEASSGANINASDLKSERSNAKASSGANIKLNVSETLKADANSAGNISYSGKAKISTKKSVSVSVTYND
jgi:ribosomal protein L31